MPSAPPPVTPQSDDDNFVPSIPVFESPQPPKQPQSSLTSSEKSGSGETQSYDGSGGLTSHESAEVPSSEVHDANNGTVIAGVVPLGKDNEDGDDHTTIILIVVPVVLVFAVILVEIGRASCRERV